MTRIEMTFEDAVNTLEGVEETLRRFATSCDTESGEAFAILNQANLLNDALEAIRQR